MFAIAPPVHAARPGMPARGVPPSVPPNWGIAKPRPAPEPPKVLRARRHRQTRAGTRDVLILATCGAAYWVCSARSAFVSRLLPHLYVGVAIYAAVRLLGTLLGQSAPKTALWRRQASKAAPPGRALMQARAELQAGQVHLARKRLRALHARVPEDAPVCATLATAEMLTHNLRQAQRLGQAALAAGSCTPAVLRQMLPWGQRVLPPGDLQRACMRALESEPKTLQFWLALASAQRRNGQRAEADLPARLGAFEQAIFCPAESPAQMADLWFGYAQALLEQAASHGQASAVGPLRALVRAGRPLCARLQSGSAAPSARAEAYASLRRQAHLHAAAPLSLEQLTADAQYASALLRAHLDASERLGPADAPQGARGVDLKAALRPPVSAGERPPPCPQCPPPPAPGPRPQAAARGEADLSFPPVPKLRAGAPTFVPKGPPPPAILGHNWMGQPAGQTATGQPFWLAAASIGAPCPRLQPAPGRDVPAARCHLAPPLVDAYIRQALAQPACGPLTALDFIETLLRPPTGDAGHPVYVVGGLVRDALRLHGLDALPGAPHVGDVDLATSADPATVMRLGSRLAQGISGTHGGGGQGASFETIKWGTNRFNAAGSAHPGIDMGSLRAHGVYAARQAIVGSSAPEQPVVFGDSLMADARFRCSTPNMLYYFRDPQTPQGLGTIYDPSGLGYADALHQRVHVLPDMAEHNPKLALRVARLGWPLADADSRASLSRNLRFLLQRPPAEIFDILRSQIPKHPPMDGQAWLHTVCAYFATCGLEPAELAPLLACAPALQAAQIAPQGPGAQ